MKRLDRAKRRLAEHLSARDHREAVTALLADALDLCASASFFTWLVVSDDDEVLRRAQERGFGTVTDRGRGLNDALALAVDVAAQAGATSATIIPSDVPLAWAGDLRDILDTGETSDIVVVPSRDGGTNALYLSPPDVMSPHFGTASFTAHLAEAERLGKRCSILSLARLELDIDTIEAGDLFLARPKAAESASATVLARVRGDATTG